MTFVIPDDLHPSLVPLAWLVGRWEGVGVLGYPGLDEARFGQEVHFRHDGRDFLHYSSQMHLLDDAGEVTAPIDSETGYWRVAVAADPEAAAARAPGVDVEVLLAHPTGVVEVYVGRATGARVDLVTDVVARTRTAAEYTAAQRIYGHVGNELMWALDVAAGGHPMASYASAALKRA